MEGKKKSKKVKLKKTLCLRLVFYRDEQGRKYRFITNNWEITDEEVALIYKCRWSIETTFKKLKQNFQLTYFYPDTENRIKTQVWCTLIAYLLLLVIQTNSGSQKALSTIAALIRMHLISHLELNWVVTQGRGGGIPNAQRVEIKAQRPLNCRCFEGGKVLKKTKMKITMD